VAEDTGAGGGFDVRTPWGAAFAGALVLLAASLAFLMFVLATSGANDGTAPVSDGGVLPSFPGIGSRGSPTPSRLSVAGRVPASLDPGQFPRVAASGGEDLLFASFPGPAEGAVEGRLFVPVVSPSTGVYELTRSQLERLLSGEVRRWSSVGGLDQPVSVSWGAPEDQALLSAWFPGAAPANPRSYAEVVADVAAKPGAVALVPVDAVGPSVVAVAVDGIDPVRGTGEVARWPFWEFLKVTATTSRGRSALDAVRAQVAAVTPAPVTVVLTGDILQSRCTLDRIRATGDWGAALRSPVGEYLARADLALGSLDGSIQDINPPFGCIAMTNLSSPPEVIEALSLAGIDGMTVATNHIFDCGQAYCGDRAFLRTLELLNAAGIKTWGGGRNLQEALAPVIFEVRGVRFGVLGFDDVAAYELEATDTAAGTAPLDDDYSQEIAAGEPSFYRPASELGIERFLATIRALRPQVDVVIVQVQSGTEETHAPSARSLKALPAAVAAGADVVVGNQAHWVQAVQYGDRAFTAYALGNFIFDQVWTPEHTEGVLLETTFHGKRLVTTRLRPYVIMDQYRPQFVTGERALKILGDIYDASADLR